jgi:hypothetical protein
MGNFRMPASLSAESRNRSASHRLRGRLCFALVVVAVGVVWLVALPRLAKQAQIAARVEWLKEKRINPAAMYYTEVEALDPILKRMDRRTGQNVPKSGR